MTSPPTVPGTFKVLRVTPPCSLLALTRPLHQKSPADFVPGRRLPAAPTPLTARQATLLRGEREVGS